MSAPILTTTQAISLGRRAVAEIAEATPSLARPITEIKEALDVLEREFDRLRMYRPARAAVPSEVENRILKRIYPGRGYLLLTQRDGAQIYSYEDGSLIRLGNGFFSEVTFQKFRVNGWITGVPGENLFGGLAQRWVAAKQL